MGQDFHALEAVLAGLSKEFAGRAAEHDRSGTFPFENFRRLHELGLLGLTIPRESGGRGGGIGEARQVVQAVARGCASTALVLVMQYIFQMMVARAPGWPEHLRERIAGDAIRDGALINALSVEPELGTPTRGGSLATVGRRTAGGWAISGRKLYSTGMPGLTWLAVVGRTDEPEPRRVMFVVRSDAPGIRTIENWDHLGMRATGSHEVVFEDTPVPAEDVAVLDARSAAAGLAANVLLGSLYDGVAQAARDWLVGFLKARQPSNLGAPLATLPRFQEAVGTIESLLFVNRSLLDQAAAAADRPEPAGLPDVPLIKHLVTRNSIEVVAKALELTGNHGLSRRNPLERHYRDVLCGRVHSPHDDVILIAAGRRALAIEDVRELAK